MPQSIDKYKILVASPSDVLDERESMDEVITELNHTYGSRTKVILELIKWETHSAPAASEKDVQDLIDKGISAIPVTTRKDDKKGIMSGKYAAIKGWQNYSSTHK